MGFGFDLSDGALRARVIAAFAGLFAIVVSWSQLQSVILASPDGPRVLDAETPSEICASLLMTFGFALVVAQAWRDRVETLSRNDWVRVALGIGLVALTETADWFSDVINEHFWFEEFWVQVPAWLFAALTMRRCTRFYRDDPRVAQWFRVGMACQMMFSILTIATDVIGDETLGHAMGAAVDHASLLAALCYVSAILLCVVSPSTVRPGRAWIRAPLQHARIGTSAATMHVRDRAQRHRGDSDRLAPARFHLRWPLAVIGSALRTTWHNGRDTRRSSGRSVVLQFLDQVRLGALHSLPPPWYYGFNLAEAGPRQRTVDYLRRFDTRGIARDFLARPADRHPVAVLGDDAGFGARCRMAGVPVLAPAAAPVGTDHGRGARPIVHMITIRNEDGAYELTDAVCRSSGEPATPVDITSGTVASARLVDGHPFSGGRIHGRALPFWERCRALVHQAHAQFPERVAVGWDVAILAEGPVIVEGNGCPDLDIVRRMARRPIGNTRYGELLAYNLRRAVSERSARLFTRGDNDNG